MYFLFKKYLTYFTYSCYIITNKKNYCIRKCFISSILCLLLFRLTGMALEYVTKDQSYIPVHDASWIYRHTHT